MTSRPNLDPTPDTPPETAPETAPATRLTIGQERARRGRVLGALGEAHAAAHLVSTGMVVLDRNWRCEAGEIDLVLRDGATVVVCEVKTRSSTAFGSPVEAVSGAKAARLRRLAACWLRDHPVRAAEVRIDLVGVLALPGQPPRLDHVRGVG